MPVVPDSRAAAVRAEQVRVLHATVPAVLVGSTFMGGILAWLLWNVVDPSRIVRWLVLLLAIGAARGILLAWHRRTPPEKTDTDLALNLFRLGVLSAGVAWGVAGGMLFPEGDIIHQTWMAFVLAGLASGAASAYVCDISSIFAFLLPTLVPFVLRLFMEGSAITTAMGIAVTIYIAYVLSTTRQPSRRFREDIFLRFEAAERERALQASEERFRRLFERHDSPMLLIDPRSGAIMNANAAASRFYGHTVERMCGMAVSEIELPGTRDMAGTTRRVSSHRLAGGEVRTVEMHSSPVEVGGATQLFSIIHDVTDRVTAEAGLHLRDAALNASANAIVITDREGRIKWANQAYTDLTGYRLEEAAGRTLKEMESGPQGAPHLEALWRTILSGHPWRGELVNQRKDGSLYPEEITVTPVRDANNEICNFVAVKQDITERKETERQIHELAFYDTLTQLPNRRLLIERLDLAIIAGKRNRLYGALMFLDLDKFKSVNDTHGHDIGDLLLVEASRRLVRCVRAENTVARLGGDEFVIMLERLNADREVSTSNAVMVAEKIRESLSVPYRLQRRQSEGFEDAVECDCTASIGIAIFHHEGTKEDALSRADTAMYQAKTTGGNKVLVSGAP